MIPVKKKGYQVGPIEYYGGKQVTMLNLFITRVAHPFKLAITNRSWLPFYSPLKRKVLKKKDREPLPLECYSHV